MKQKNEYSKCFCYEQKKSWPWLASNIKLERIKKTLILQTPFDSEDRSTNFWQ